MGVDGQLLTVLGEFARTLGTDFEVQEILDHLAQRIVDVLPITAAGVTLIAPGASPRYVAASNGSALRFEQLQSELDEGPCRLAYRTGEAVSVPDLREEGRFPRFGPHAVAEGLLAVFTFPLRHGTEQLGALDLYRTTAGPLDDEAMTAAQTLADVAAAYLLNAWARVELDEIAERARKSALHDDQAVKALRASEARKASILDSALDAVITTDQLGRIVEFSPAAERTFGFPKAEALGRDLGDLILPADDRDAYENGRAHVSVTGLSKLIGQRTEMTAMRADGSLFPAEVSVSAVDAPGARFFTGFFRDLTDKAAADGQRRTLEERLQQSERLESLGQLAGGVAHDFNNLLTVILGYASMTLETADHDGSARANAEEIISASQRAARLTQQLLTFAHREPIRHEPVDLNAIIAEVHSLLTSSIGEHVKLVVNPAPGLPLVLADRGQTEQVLVNLVLNARDAMPDGGTVTITTEVAELGDAFAHQHPKATPGTHIQLSVSDTGTGMSVAVAARALDPFYTTKPKGAGSGLGLSIVYGIVTDAGGVLDLSSEEGIGTMIRAYFPVAHASQVAPPRATTEPGEGAGQVILVVEDDAAVRQVTVTMLRRNGYFVYEAADASEAIAIASAQDFDLLLTDLVMPERSGVELVEELARLPCTHQVLFMSGYSADVLGPAQDPERSVPLLRKPFSEHALLDQVQRALARRSP